MAEITSANSSTIVGYFESHKAAESAVVALQDAGFQANEVGVAAGKFAGDSTNTQDGNHETGLWDKVRNFFDGNVAEPYADENAKGDLATHEITTDRSASTYAASPSYSSKGTSYDATDYEADDVHGSLSGLSVPAEQSRYFGDKLRKGGALVTVSAGNRRDEAIAILEDSGADIGNKGAGYESTNYETATAAATAGNSVDNLKDVTDRNIQLYGEVLRVHKDRINRGEVRIRKEVLTETQTVEVPVTREELVLERVAVNGNQPVADATFGGESEIRIPLTEERASVEKNAVVREEVKVGKREVSSVENLSEQVRHEELKVEDETKTRAS